MTVRVPVGRLPADPHARHGRLRDYFCDKDAQATLADGEWRLELAWPGGAERHVDARIGSELAAWDGIELSGMAMARRRSGRVLTALYDTWTLPSWSEWVARSRPGPDEPVTILHVDDHRDLGSPRLGLDAEGAFDLITGGRFDIADSGSVIAACESGAVGMGSFMTPFLHAFPACDVRHLGQAPKVSGTTDYAFRAVKVEDDLLAPGVPRPAISVEPGSARAAGRLRATDDLVAWLEGIRPGPILLHIDMDYFNNRYDGDGDWPDRFPRHDPPVEDVLGRIDEVTLALRGAGLMRRIEDAVVAFSPGFFPAELWGRAEERLRSGMAELYD